jgi:hypothetical protein
LEVLEDRLAPAAVHWTGNAGTLNWGDANNWLDTNNQSYVPGAGDDVTINKSGVGTITIGAAYSAHTLNDSTAVLTILSTGTLTLSAVAATSTFAQNLTIQTGGGLTVGAGATVVVGAGSSTSITDNGTMTFQGGNTLTLNDSGYYNTATVTIGSGGLLQATSTIGTTFNASALNGSNGVNSSSIVVSSGGHLQSTNGTFSVGQLNFNIGANIGAGDIVNNGFDLPLYVPAMDVQYLTGSNNSNLRFRDIILQPDTLTNTQSVALNVQPQQNSPNLRYIFSGNFTINQGATLTVAPNATVLVGTGASSMLFNDYGTVVFGSADTVTLNDSGYYITSTMTLYSGALLQATTTNFNAAAANGSNGVNATSIVVTSGGHLQSTNDTFSVGQLNFNIGANLGTGDLVNNGFDLPLYVPAMDVQYLTGTSNSNLRFNDINIQPDTLTNGQNVNLNVQPQQNSPKLRYVFTGSSFTINQGATLTVAANATVVIGTGSGSITFNDYGSVVFGSADVVTLNDSGYYIASTVTVYSGGLLQATGTNFNAAAPNGSNGVNSTSIVVSSGGHLQSTGGVFSVGQLNFNIGANLGTGDLVNNGFDLPLYVPAMDVQYFTGSNNSNLRFKDINLQPDTLTSGQSVALNVQPQQNSPNLHYIFSGTFTINQGAMLTVAPNATVFIGTGSSSIAFNDYGTVVFAPADTVTLNDSGYYITSTITVYSGGLLQAIGTGFNAAAANGTNGVNSTAIIVNSGGHLQSANGTFAVGQLNFNVGANLATGDLVNNGFDLPLYVPIMDVQYLTGSSNSNLRFKDILLQADTLVNGQNVALNVQPQQTSPNMRYVFSGAFTINQGATLTVTPNATVVVGQNSSVTLSDNGTLQFGSGDTVSLNNNGYYQASQITVGTGAVLQATSDNISGAAAPGSNGNNTASIIVNSGGHFITTNSSFSTLTQVYLDNNSILNATDFTGDSFNCPLWLPITDVPNLSSTGATQNAQFQAIDILAGGLSTGTVALGVIGTYSTNLSYIFQGNFTVQLGATLNVGAFVKTIIPSQVTLTVAGTMNFANGDTLTFQSPYSGFFIVANGGVVNSAGTTFTGVSGYTEQITVNTGGQFNATGSTFTNLSAVILSTGSVDTLQYDTFAVQIQINSRATLTINQNDLTNIPGSHNGIIASGPAGDHINMVNNYWGTQDPVAISAKITDHNTNTSLPTVDFTPPMSQFPTQTVAANATASFSYVAQTVTLNAVVTSPSSVVNQGTVTFTLYDSSNNQVGNPASGSVNNEAATANYTLPAGTTIGTYTIVANYQGNTNYANSSDNTHTFTVGIATATTTASNASVTYATGNQNATLTATVKYAGGNVNEGTETFTILNGGTPVGSGPVTVNVVNGVATTSNYGLPPALPGGTYTLKADYSGTSRFTASSDASHSITVNPEPTTTAAGNSSLTFSTTGQNASLSATVSSSIGAMSEGTLTFTILDQSSNKVGNPVTVSVTSGSASALYPLPGATSGGNYTIKAVYNGTNNYAASTDTSHTLTINAAGTSTAASNAATSYSTADQTVTLNATVNSPAGNVNEGTETFTLYDGGGHQVGNSVTASVSAGAASKGYVIPGNTPLGTYTITAVYNPNADLQTSTDSSHTLTITAASATVAISLDAGSNSGAPDHPGYTNDTTPTFDVQVNQAGTITVDFDGNAAHDQTQTVSAAGTYQFTAPTLANGSYTATASFNAGAAGHPQNTTGYVIDTVAPQVTGFGPTGTVNNRVAQATVTFSEFVDLGTFTPSAITLTGPSGSVPVGQPFLVSGTTYSIPFIPQNAQGSYSLTIAANVTDFAANPMGQSSGHSFSIALPDLAMTSTSAPSTATLGVSFPVSWEVTNQSTSNPTGGIWYDAVYVSTKSTLDGTALPLKSVPATTTPLAPQDGYATSTSVTIPANVGAGSYYLLFVANADNGQAEADAGNDTNDVVADPITLLAPDLQVTAVSGPSHGYNGQAAVVSWTDQNTGSVAATGSWIDNVYTASDAQGHNPTLLGSFTFTGTLKAGASVQRIQSVILPQVSGTQWFMVTTNATATIAESNYSNDTSVAGTSINITAAPLPDLVVTSITPPPNGVLSGNSVPVSFVVKNQGQAPTSVPQWQDWVILSQDPNLGQAYQGQLNGIGPGGDQLLNNQPIILGFNNPSYLAVGDSYQQNVSVPLPINAQGTWYVYVVPDGTGAHHPFAMPEVSRADKLKISTAFSITLSPPPDLAVSGVTAPSQPFSGQPINVGWTVTNNGTGPTAAQAWTDAVYMSAHSTLDGSAILLGKFPHQGALASGASYSSDPSVTLPIGVYGQFYFLVQTDFSGQVFENGATGNNVAATTSAETINLTPPPDLVVSSISAPATATAGQPFTFSYTVTNAGSNPTPNYTWTDAIYLSPTATFNAGTAISLGQQVHQGILAKDAAYTNAVTTTLSNGLVGTYYVVVTTDSGNVVFEGSYENNNTTVAGSGTQIAMAPADLVVPSVVGPSQAVPGSAIWINWTVVNKSTGNTDAGTWQDSVYIDSGSTLDGNAILLGSYTHHGVLIGGASYSPAELINVPINLLGNYNLFIVTNSSGDVYESNTSNDTSPAAPITITQTITDGGGGGGGGGGNGGNGGGNQQGQVSDLEPTTIAGPSSALTGGTVTVNWTVINNGPGTTNANWWNDNVWMSTQTTLGSGGTDVFLGTVQHNNALSSGDSYSASGTFTLPRSMPADNYFIIVATDSGNQVYEADEMNNDLALGSATTVSVGPTPEFTTSGVSIPVSATSGQQLAVSWTVTNNGVSTGNVPISDSVYLSYDQVFDPTSDHYLGSLSHNGGLGAGASYTENGSFALPAGLAGTFYAIVVANSNHAVFEADTSNDVAASPSSVQIQLPPPADLVAGTVTIPPSAVAGESITINYQVSNNGGNAANGTWSDALYLSPTPTWNVSDPLLGKVSQTQNLAPGDSYNGSLTAPLPGVAPGSYYVIVRSNIMATLPELTLANNLSASVTSSAIDATLLTLGVPTHGTLNQTQSAYYKAIVSAGQTLQVSFASQNPASYNELYVSFGTMPTRSQYDYRYTLPFTANQSITIPTTQAGAYYILAYGDNVPSPPESYTIEAAIVPFSIQSVAPTQAGTGPVTLTINGAQFKFDTTFQLRNAGGTTLNATRTLLQDSATAYATFDLTGQAQGSYDVWAIQHDNTSTKLAGGLHVVAAMQNNSVQLNLVLPQAVLVGRPGSITVTYSNPGNTDLPAPFILLKGENALFQVPGQTGYTQSELQLLGFNPAGPYGTLPPGFQGSINIPFEPATAGVGLASTFTLEALADPSEPFDWNAVVTNDIPLETSPQEWAAMVSQAAPVLGSTWGAVVTSLDNDSVQLVKNIHNAADVSSFNSLYNFDVLLQYAVGVYGLPMTAPTTPNLTVAATLGEVNVYNGNVGSDGNPVPLNSTYPTFVIIPGFNGYRADFGNLAATIAGDLDCYGGQVNVLIATWQGEGGTPMLDGIGTPWMAAVHVDSAGTDLGNILTSLNQHGEIAYSTTTVIGEDLGVYVGNQAARIAGGLENALAFNPASALTGYLPPSLTHYFQHSTAYETSSIFDAQEAIAASNQTLATADLNDPLLLHTFGIAGLTTQVALGNCELLDPTYNAGPDNIPPANDPPPVPFPTGVVVASGQVIQIISHDPNSIIGPKGSSTNEAVPKTLPLPYTVLFTNTSNTPGPAQQVEVEEQMDPNLDWRTFDVSNFGFRGMNFSVPAGSSYYQTTLDLTQQFGIDVAVTMTIDTGTGIAKFLLTAIDPATGQIPLNPTIGLLPPDVSNGVGEGYVSYTIKAKASDATGTVVSAQAGVVFDNSPPLNTNQVSNTIDAGDGLTSTVTALPPYEDTNPFLVSWTGSDASNGSGLANFTIYVSDNGGPYTVWLQNTTLSSAPYMGQNGHTYAFYSVATDNAGNVQPTPSGAEATTVVDLVAPTSLAASANYDNAGSFTVSYTANDALSGVAKVDVYVKGPTDSSYQLVHTFTGTGLTSGSFTYTAGEGDGSYKFKTVATDSAGNVETTHTSADATTVEDRVKPSSTATTLPFANSTTISVNYTASDDRSGLAEVDLYAQGPGGGGYTKVASTTSNLASGTFSFHAGLDGAYSFYTMAIDNAGNVSANSPPTATVLDTKVPNSSGTSTNISSSATIAVNYTASDPQQNSSASGLAEVDLYAQYPGGSGYTKVASTTTSLASGSFSFQGTVDGAYSFYTVAIDQAGNVGANSTPTGTLVDTQAPTSTVHSPTYSTGTTINVTYTAVDPLKNGSASGLAEVDLYVEAPGTSSYTKVASTTTNLANGTFTYQAAADGYYSFYTVAGDLAGNVGTNSPPMSTLVDTQAPISTVSAPPFSTSTAITVSYTAQDPLNGGSANGLAEVDLYAQSPGGSGYTMVASTTTNLASGSFTFNGAADGSYSFYTVAIDQAGNVGANSPAQSTLLDTVVPTSTASAAPYSTSTTFSVNYTAQDPQSNGSASGLAEVDLYEEGPGDSGYTKVASTTSNLAGGSFTVNGAQDGTYSFYTIAVDQAGNAGNPSTPAITMIDTQQAVATAHAPQFSSSPTITVNYTAQDPLKNGSASGLAEIDLNAEAPGASSYILVASTTSNLASGSFSYSGTLDGSYSFYTVAIDLAGNVGTGSIPTSTLVDTHAPTTSANSPQFSTGATITVNYTAQDPASNGSASGLAEVDLYEQDPAAGGFTKVASTTTSLASGSFTVPASVDGSYSFYTIAIDQASNISAGSTPSSTLVDTQKPTSTANSAPLTTSPTLTVNYTAQDPLQNGSASGLAEVDLYEQGPGGSGYTKVASTTTSLASGSFTFTGSADGNYSFYTVALDQAGNASAPSTPTATLVDTQAPASTASSPAYSTTPTIDVSYAAQDPLNNGSASGLAEVDLYEEEPGASDYMKVASTTSNLATGTFTFDGSADGIYSFYTVAIDLAGNVGAPSTSTSTLVDTAGPTSTASSPAYSIGTTISVGYTAQLSSKDGGSGGLSEVDLYARAPGAGGYVKVASTTTDLDSGTFSYVATADGSYSFYTVASDKAGNIGANSSTTTTVVDTQLPGSTASSPQYATTATVAVDYTAADPLKNASASGLAEIDLYAEAPGTGSYTKVASTTSSLTAGSFAYIAALDGHCSFYTVAIDQAGNVGAASTPTGTLVDTQKPLSTVSAPQFSTGTTISVGYTAEDPLSNGSASGLAEVDLYEQDPGASGYTKVASTTSNLASGSFTFHGSLDGSYSFYTVALDQAGNASAGSTPTSTLVDTLKPISTGGSAQFSTGTTINVSYTAQDPLSNGSASGLAEVDLYQQDPGAVGYTKVATTTSNLASGSFTFHGSVDGSYSFYTVAIDQAGNASAGSTPTSTLLDTQLPNSTASAPAFSVGTAITVIYTAQDPLSNGSASGLAEVELWEKGPGAASYTQVASTTSNLAGGNFAFQGSVDGSYSFYTVAVDQAGNIGAASAPTSTHIDTQKPSATVSSLQYSTGTTITVGYTAQDPLSNGSASGLAEVDLYEQDPGASGYTKVASTTSNLASGSFTFHGSLDGEYSFYTVALDQAGNVGSGSTSTTTLVDSVKPASTASSPPFSTGTTITVNYTAQDAPRNGSASGLAEVDLYEQDPGASGYTKVASATSNLANGSFTFHGSLDGDYTFYTVALDQAGNASAGAPPTSTLVDTQKPSSTASTPQYSTGTTISVNYTAQDPLSSGSASGIAEIDLYEQAPGGTGYTRVASTTTNLASGSFSFPGTVDGSYSFYTVAIDQAGNVGAPSAATSTLLDTQEPGSLAVSPATSTSATINVIYTASDAPKNGSASGLAEVDLYAQGPGIPTFTRVASTTTNLASGTFTFHSTLDGVYSFYTVAIDQAGNLQAGGAAQTTTTVVLPADHLVLGAPTHVTAGGSFGITVTASDPNGGTDANYLGSVMLVVLSGPTGGKVAGTTLVPVQNGVAAFANLSLKPAGNYTLMALGAGDLLAASATITVLQAPQFKVTLTPSVPGNNSAGQSFNLTITAQVAGHPHTAYLGSVLLTSSDPQAVLPAPNPIVFGPNDHGSRTLSVILQSAGKQTVTAVDTSLASAKGTSNSINVTSTAALALDHFVITGMPASATIGTTQRVTITAVNSAGVPVTSYTGSVQLTSSDAGLTVTPSNLQAVKGVVHATVSFTTPGVQSLTAADGGGSGKSISINVNVLSPTTHLGITASASKIAAGTQETITVSALTRANQVDPLFGDTLQLTTSDPHAVVVAQPPSNGVQQFLVTYTTAGSPTISVADLTRNTVRGPVTKLTVTAGAPTQLVLSGYSPFVLAGATQKVKLAVTAEDAYGNTVVSGFTDPVTVLATRYTFRSTDHGKHTFTIPVAQAGPLAVSVVDTNAVANIPTATATIVGVSTPASIVQDPADVSKTALVIVGPASGGNIVITPTDTLGKSVSVSINGTTVAGGPFTPTGHIYVASQGGRNTIQELANSHGTPVNIPAMLFAGTGTATFSVAGSGSANVVVGGTGATALTGGSGRDILIGGGGPATLHAGTGGDILIGGSTAYNANVAALAALLNEWSRVDIDYEDRVHDLFGTGNGGANGAYQLNSQSVVADTGKSQLVGGSGSDWFWLAFGPKASDKTSAYTTGEVATIE